MDVLTAQIITMFSLFFAMILSCFVPLVLVKTLGQRASHSARFQGSRYDLGISFANCFSGGVFIATFFVGLLPRVREEFQEMLAASDTKTEFPVTEFVVFMGFFIALIIEHVTLIYQERKREKSENSKVDGKAVYTTDEENGLETTEMSYFSNSDPKNQNSHSNCLSSSESEDEKLKKHQELIMPNSHGHTLHNNHGHSHGHSHDISGIINKDKNQDSGIRFYMLVLSLSVHSVFEGMALGLQTHMSDLMNLFVGVIIHECLVAFAMGVSLSKIKPSFGVMLRFCVLFSIMIPVGQALGLIVGNQSSFIGRASGAVLQGIAAGTFIHITFLEVIPSELYHRQYILVKIFFIFLGFLLIVTSIYALGHHHSAMSLDHANNATEYHHHH